MTLLLAHAPNTQTKATLYSRTWYSTRVAAANSDWVGKQVWCISTLDASPVIPVCMCKPRDSQAKLPHCICWLEIKPLFKVPYIYTHHSLTLLLGMAELGWNSTVYTLINLGLPTFFYSSWYTFRNCLRYQCLIQSNHMPQPPLLLSISTTKLGV
jgi:hypothetical protein